MSIAMESGGLIADKDDLRAAYRLLLDREPDPEGSGHYLRWIEADKPRPANVAERLMASAEYRGRKDALIPVDLGDYTVFVRAGDKLIGASVSAVTSYEPHVMGRFMSSIVAGDYVLDVGANIGLFTMPAAVRVGDAGRVIAVEPLPQNHRALYAGIVRNRVSTVSVMPFAASDRPGLISAVCAPDSSNGIVGASPADESSEEMFVPTHRLDDVLATLNRLDVVKIDIEGHEPAAWSGMLGLLERHRPAVFTEFSPIAMKNAGQDALAYLDLIFKYTDRVWVLHRDEPPVPCYATEAVMSEWIKANSRAEMNGELHLDLHIEKP